MGGLHVSNRLPQEKQMPKGKGGGEADREVVIDLQSSCKYASPLADPRAILSLVGQPMGG